MSALEMQAAKFSIIELLTKTNNIKLIDAIREALEIDITGNDFYNDLTKKDKERIELS